MKKGVFEDFDGCERIIEAIEVSRSLAANYNPLKDLADRYVERLHPARLTFRVAEVIDEAPGTRTLRLVSAEGRPLPPFQAGQYIALFVEVDGIRTSRPYSISSPPNQRGYYEITVRRVPDGLVSGYLLDRVEPGAVLEGSGPAGNFYHNPLFHARTMVCIAGGSGITPFMSMIREVLDRGLDRTIHLFYGNRNLEEAAFHETLLRLSERHENLHYRPVIEDPPPGYDGLTGLITGELLREALGGDLEEKTFYLCGPQAMYDFCLPELEKLGIPRGRIRRELYGTPVRIWDDPGWPRQLEPDTALAVKVRGREGSVAARAGESLLTALEKAGVIVPSLCRSGECSMCRVRLLSGKVFQPAGVLLRKSDRRLGYIHSCCAFPLEDLEISLS